MHSNGVKRKSACVLIPLRSCPAFVLTSILMQILWFCLGHPNILLAQELEPRAYSISPVGTNFVLLSYITSRGDLVFDPTLPIEDAKARINATAFCYFRSMNVFGRSGNATIILPYTWGSAEGLLTGEAQRIYRSGLPDARLRFAVNLMGAPAMDLADFAKYRQKTNIGASLFLMIPTGQYDPAKLINLGSNRWTFKPEIGLSHAFARRWVLDVYAGVWLFTANNDFLGLKRTQKPLATTQFHISYSVNPRLWAAFDGTFYAGGRTTVGGILNADRQKNSRIGGTISLPLTRRQSLKLSYSRGVYVNIGGDFSTFAVAWQYLWGKGL